MQLRTAHACIFLAATAAFAGIPTSDGFADTGFAYQEVSGRIGIESRWYPDTAAYRGQKSSTNSLVLQPQFYLEDDEGRSVTLTPFLRYDSADPERSHADLREAYVLLFGEAGDGQWELRVGVDQVFWGVAESRHLVDIINQVDLVDHPNEETKLGQPMIHATWSSEWGTAELFGLTYHRPRTFPGPRGRLRGIRAVSEEDVTYESSAAEWNLDIAVRYSRSFGPFDIGISAFDGTSREPTFCPLGAPRESPEQHYEQIRQLGLDSQIIIEGWLLKLEAIHRTGAKNFLSCREEDYGAFVIGSEYSFYSVWETPFDVSVLAEWNYDGRGQYATNVFQNDVFLAARLALNDVQGTEFTMGVFEDIDYETRVLSLEFYRRLSDQWALNLEAIAFLDVDQMDVLYAGTRQDTFVGLNLSYNY